MITVVHNTDLFNYAYVHEVYKTNIYSYYAVLKYWRILSF